MLIVRRPFLDDVPPGCLGDLRSSFRIPLFFILLRSDLSGGDIACRDVSHEGIGPQWATKYFTFGVIVSMLAATDLARILDGRRIADDLLDALKTRVDARVAAGKLPPTLAVVLVGSDPASVVYVRNKRRAAEKVGIKAYDFDLPEATTEAELAALIDRLNADPKIHGVLIQLPLPGIPDAHRLIQRIDPRKDVDGFHPQNVGHLALREFGLRPCTPRGYCHLARPYRPTGPRA